MEDKFVVAIAAGGSALATALSVHLAVSGFFKARDVSPEEAAALAAEAARERAAQKSQGLARYTGLAQIMRPKTVEDLNQMRTQLSQAGMRSQDAINLFSVIRILSLFGGLGLFLVLLFATGAHPFALIGGALLLLISFMAPGIWLRGRISQRQDAINLSLPPTLDLLVTCIDAGLGLEQALARVAGEMGHSDPEIAEELSIVVGETRAGLSVSAAFRKLSERITSDEVRNLSNVIIQSSTMGAALGRTLREYASSARGKREMVLEEVAGKVTAGLTLPLTMCLLPSAVIAMLGPAVVIVIDTMFNQ
ncbi:type II secretion system F family protein [Myxococcota bacterium]|nr:type II secretion system F family protein [Myxococcota bacterium]MBU1432940.1 type II secretion system F family protein [Myxococcota bacterium]MBU1896242.1 type II secretion system F family protein [Myxococcota bacterium]